MFMKLSKSCVSKATLCISGTLPVVSKSVSGTLCQNCDPNLKFAGEVP